MQIQHKSLIVLIYYLAFEMIRQAKPPKLFIVADGACPNRPGEVEKCKATRSIVDKIDWDCKVFKDYSDINLGSGRRVSSGLSWVFSHVEEAIILEDDCVPNTSFFPFCQELLHRYKHDNRILTISGQNFALKHRQVEYSYYFSRYHHSWGWASWRRAWQYFDLDMKLWSEVKAKNLLKNILEDSQAVEYWNRILQSTYNGQLPLGACLDFYTGTVYRGPRWMTNRGLEWLTRFFTEPQRLWERYVVGNPLFFYRLIRERVAKLFKRSESSIY